MDIFFSSSFGKMFTIYIGIFRICGKIISKMNVFGSFFLVSSMEYLNFFWNFFSYSSIIIGLFDSVNYLEILLF